MARTLVMKFGGTSVGSPAAIRQAVEIVRAARADWPRVAVVVSAMSGVTDALLRGAHSAAAGDETAAAEIAADLRAKHTLAANELAAPDGLGAVLAHIAALVGEFEALCQAVRVLGEASPRALDAISSLGERLNVPIVAAALAAGGVVAEAVDAAKVVVTDAVHQSA